MVTVEEIIERIDAWRGRPLSIRPLTKGLTNANYRVDVDGQAFVVRIPGASTELLAIDRANELYSARVAAALGIGPAVLHHFAGQRRDRHRVPPRPAHDQRHAEGAGHARADRRDAARAPRWAPIPPRLRHAGPRRRVLGRDPSGGASRRRPVTGPGDLPSGKFGAALAVRPLPSLPCHNDLLADNYIEQEGRLRLVDWEYSGNGDPAFELGNTCRELDYDDVRLLELCRAYFGRATASLVGRVRLHMIVSDVGWTLWAAIQTAISRIAFDFSAYGAARWTRAEAAMDSA